MIRAPYAVLLALLCAPLFAQASAPHLASRNAASPGATANGPAELENYAGGDMISDDGRFVVYHSTATDVVVGQTDSNFGNDVFLFDRTTQTVVLVSHVPGSATTAGNAAAFGARISADGNFVAYHSTATNLVSGQNDGNGSYDVFLYDRVAGTNSLVSRASGASTTAADAASSSPSMSGDGRYIAFASGASNIVAGQSGSNQVFVFDRVAGTSIMASRAASSPTTGCNASAGYHAISKDGNYVVFSSQCDDAVAGMTGGNWAVFLNSRVSGVTVLVSRNATSHLVTGNGSAGFGTLSADGRYCAWITSATDTVSGSDNNGSFDLFLFDRVSGTNALISHAAGASTTAANGNTGSPSQHVFAVSDDGNYVAYQSDASDLIAGQATSFTPNIFLYDRAANTSRLVSSSSGSATSGCNGDSQMPSISSDGRYVAFTTAGTDLQSAISDSNGAYDIYRFDRTTGQNTLVSRTLASASTTGNSDSVTALISGDGNVVAFISAATNLAATDGNGGNDAFCVSFAAATPPTLSGVSPTSGSTFGGTNVTLTGTGFTGATAVTFDGVAATNLAVVSATSITCTTPAHAAGAVSVIVTTAAGSNAANSLFTYNTPPAPTLGGVSPSSGSMFGGTAVTLTGTDFLGAISVTFDGVAATNLVVVSITSITCTTPANAAGAASVIVTTAGGSNLANGAFTYTPPSAPTVTAVSPNTASVAGGVSVTITGTDFTGATSVSFGGTAAGNVSVVSPTSITCDVPAHAAGQVSVDVTTPGGTNAANTLFTYVTGPEMNVSRGTPLADGGSDSAGSAAFGTALTLTYTISNNGGSALTLSNAVLSGQTNCTVTVTQQPSASVAASASTSLVISVTPTAAGAFSFMVSITNNDSDESPYDWTAAGTGFAPPIGGGGASGGGGGGGCAAANASHGMWLLAAISLLCLARLIRRKA